MKLKKLDIISEGAPSYISFETHNDNDIMTPGGSKIGILTDVSYFELVSVFGEPLPRDVTPEGTEWNIEFTVEGFDWEDDTEIVKASIYDRNNLNERDVQNNTEWTIGGDRFDADLLVREALDNT